MQKVLRLQSAWASVILLAGEVNALPNFISSGIYDYTSEPTVTETPSTTTSWGHNFYATTPSSSRIYGLYLDPPGAGTPVPATQVVADSDATGSIVPAVDELGRATRPMVTGFPFPVHFPVPELPDDLPKEISESIIASLSEDATESTTDSVFESIASSVSASVTANVSDIVDSIVSDSIKPDSFEPTTFRPFESITPSFNESIPTVTEDFVPSVTESISDYASTEDTVPSNTEDIVPSVTETISDYTEDTEASITEEVVPSVTDETAPSSTEEDVSRTTEDIAPSNTEGSVPSSNQDSVPDSAPSSTEDTVPSSTEDTDEVVPSTTEDFASSTTEELVPSTTEDVISVSTEEVISTSTEELVPIVTEDVVPSINEDTGEVVSSNTEDAASSTTEEVVTSATETVVTNTTVEVVTNTTEKIVTTTTEEVITNTTEKVISSRTEDIVPSISESIESHSALTTSALYENVMFNSSDFGTSGVSGDLASSISKSITLSTSESIASSAAEITAPSPTENTTSSSIETTPASINESIIESFIESIASSISEDVVSSVSVTATPRVPETVALIITSNATSTVALNSTSSSIEEIISSVFESHIPVQTLSVTSGVFQNITSSVVESNISSATETLSETAIFTIADATITTLDTATLPTSTTKSPAALSTNATRTVGRPLFNSTIYWGNVTLPTDGPPRHSWVGSETPASPTQPPSLENSTIIISAYDATRHPHRPVLTESNIIKGNGTTPIHRPPFLKYNESLPTNKYVFDAGPEIRCKTTKSTHRHAKTGGPLILTNSTRPKLGVFLNHTFTRHYPRPTPGVPWNSTLSELNTTTPTPVLLFNVTITSKPENTTTVPILVSINTIGQPNSTWPKQRPSWNSSLTVESITAYPTAGTSDRPTLTVGQINVTSTTIVESIIEANSSLPSSGFRQIFINTTRTTSIDEIIQSNNTLIPSLFRPKFNKTAFWTNTSFIPVAPFSTLNSSSTITLPPIVPTDTSFKHGPGGRPVTLKLASNSTTTTVRLGRPGRPSVGSVPWVRPSLATPAPFANKTATAGSNSTTVRLPNTTNVESPIAPGHYDEPIVSESEDYESEDDFDNEDPADSEDFEQPAGLPSNDDQDDNASPEEFEYAESVEDLEDAEDVEYDDDVEDNEEFNGWYSTSEESDVDDESDEAQEPDNLDHELESGKKEESEPIHIFKPIDNIELDEELNRKYNQEGFWDDVRPSHEEHSEDNDDSNEIEDSSEDIRSEDSRDSESKEDEGLDGGPEDNNVYEHDESFDEQAYSVDGHQGIEDFTNEEISEDHIDFNDDRSADEETESENGHEAEEESDLENEYEVEDVEHSVYNADSKDSADVEDDFDYDYYTDADYDFEFKDDADYKEDSGFDADSYAAGTEDFDSEHDDNFGSDTEYEEESHFEEFEVPEDDNEEEEHDSTANESEQGHPYDNDFAWNSPGYSSRKVRRDSGGIPTRDGTCGGKNKYTCIGFVDGSCCGASGWCGNTTGHCGTGCNPAFGNCDESGSASNENNVESIEDEYEFVRRSPTPDGSCGGKKKYSCFGFVDGSCCGASGWCGNTPAHCGTGCDPKFGTCGPSLGKAPISSSSKWVAGTSITSKTLRSSVSTSNKVKTTSPVWSSTSTSVMHVSSSAKLVSSKPKIWSSAATSATYPHVSKPEHSHVASSSRTAGDLEVEWRPSTAASTSYTSSEFEQSEYPEATSSIAWQYKDEQPEPPEATSSISWQYEEDVESDSPYEPVYDNYHESESESNEESEDEDYDYDSQNEYDYEELVYEQLEPEVTESEDSHGYSTAYPTSVTGYREYKLSDDALSPSASKSEVTSASSTTKSVSPYDQWDSNNWGAWIEDADGHREPLARQKRRASSPAHSRLTARPCQHLDTLALLNVQDTDSGKHYYVRDQPCVDKQSDFRPANKTIPQEVLDKMENGEANYYRLDGDFLYFVKLTEESTITPILVDNDEYIKDQYNSPECRACTQVKYDCLTECTKVKKFRIVKTKTYEVKSYYNQQAVIGDVEYETIDVPYPAASTTAPRYGKVPVPKQTAKASGGLPLMTVNFVTTVTVPAPAPDETEAATDGASPASVQIPADRVSDPTSTSTQSLGASASPSPEKKPDTSYGRFWTPIVRAPAAPYASSLAARMLPSRLREHLREESKTSEAGDLNIGVTKLMTTVMGVCYVLMV